MGASGIGRDRLERPAAGDDMIIDHPDQPSLMQPVPVQIRRPSHVRYVVLGLTVVAYMITYMDRQILAVARPVIRDDLGISLVMMGWITFAFRIAYALFQIPGG